MNDNDCVLVFDIETTGLSPFDDRVTVIGLRVDDTDYTFINEDEEVMLREFWSFTELFLRWKLVGFNIYAFDIPFLVARSFKYGIRIPDLKYRVVDLRLMLSFGNKYAKGKLEDFARLLCVPAKLNGLTGAEAISLWHDGNYDDLKSYVLQDVNITAQIFERCLEVGLL
jgi:uncharacterized protein YprB with RNaseH-like and TPR domain